MRGTVLYGPRDVRFEDREAPRIGADSVLECVGSEESMMQAIKSTRPGGGSIGYVGVRTE